MLVQPKKRISAPHSLLDPWVPGRLLPSGQWGINRAAVFAFPDLGMLVLIPAWAKKDIGDTVKLLLDGREVDGRPIINKSELDQPTVLSVAPRHLQTGSYELTYEIKQPNQKEERPDKPLDLFVKLELPGGQDTDPDPGHSNLYMYIPPEIVNGGVDKDVAEEGVPIVIRSESGSGLPYPDIAVDDVILLSWGGTLVASTPVTQAQIDDPVANPILIWITKAIIERVGDTDDSGLAVTFKVRDKVDNESEDWCKETRIVVTVGINRLNAPIVQEAFNNKLDVDKQGNNDITAVVTATGPRFELNDIIYLTMFGTTVDGEEIKVPAPTQIIDNLPHNYHFKLPIADVRKLVNTQVMFSYHLVRNGSSLPLSKGQFVDFEGVAHRLAAPTVKEAVGDFIDPGNKEINIRIPFDPLIEIDNAIELFLLGKSPDGSTHLPDLGYYFPDEKDLANPDGFTINVADDPLEPINGGNLEVWYHLLKDKGAEITRQESVHARVLNVGEPQFELNAPMVKGVENHFLEPGNLPGGTTEMTIYKPLVRPWVIDDEAQWFWEGDVSGGATGSIKFNALTVRQDWLIRLDAEFVAKHIEPNRGSKITVRYQLWRNATEETSLSNPLVFTVGVALELLAPWIKENNGDSALNPLLVRDTLTIVVPDNPELRPTDEIIVTWTGAQGTPAGGSHTSVPRPLGSNREFAIPNSVVAFNLNKDVKVSYVVIRDGEPLPSLVFDLTVLSMPQNELLKPIIKDADNNGEGPEFNVGKLTANAIYRMGIWPLIATGQYVWLRLKGTNADGSDYNLQIHTAPGSMVGDQWLDQGYYERSIALAGLKNLKDGSALTMEFKAAFGKDPNESLAVAFPVRTYTIKALEDVQPEITRAEDSKGVEIPQDSPTIDTTVKLFGAAAKGQKVQIKDGTTVKGEAAVDPTTGLWEMIVAGLSVDDHSFTATALYGSGQVSAAWTLTVTANTAPTITQAVDSKGVAIPQGSTTIDATVKLFGAAAKGQKVQIKDGTTVKGEAAVDPTTGLWELIVAGLSVDDHSFTATALYGSGQVSAAWTLTVTANTAPTITQAVDSKGVAIPQGSTTIDATVKLFGAAAKGQKVQIKDGTTVKGEAAVDPTTGLWELIVAGLSVDDHSFTATALYGSGQVSAAWTLTVTANTAPTITQAVDSKGVAIPQGSTTIDATVKLFGAAAKGQKVQIKDGTTVKGEAAVDPTTGLWEMIVAGLSVDDHSFTATALYGSGQVSAAWTLTVTANTAPTITQAVDSKGVAIPQGSTTIDATVKLFGAAAKGQKVQIKDGTTVKGEAAVDPTTGLWELIVAGLSVDDHSFTATALYGSGQVSAAWTLTVTANTAPTITQAVDSKGVAIPQGSTTIDATVKLFGAAAKGQKVQIKDGTTVKGEAAVDPTTGLWELIVAGLSVDDHSFTATALYGSGQVSAAWTLTVTANTAPTITQAVDSKGVAIPQGSTTIDATVKLFGAAAKGQKVQIKDGTTVKGEAAVDPTTGLWEMIVAGLSVDDHSFTATALYGSGQVSAAWTLTVTANTAPTITKTIDSKGVAIAKGGTTVDTTVTASGAGAKGQKVQIKDGNTVKGEATVNLTTGLWELTMTGLSVDDHSFTATALYGSGQVSAAWVVIVSLPILSENFDNMSESHPTRLDIPSMTIERTPGQGQDIFIFYDLRYPRPFSGESLMINGGPKTITLTFRHAYSYISFNYAGSYLPGTVAKFYDSNNRPLGEKPLLTSHSEAVAFLEFQKDGIQKMIVTTGNNAVSFDNFIFRL